MAIVVLGLAACSDSKNDGYEPTDGDAEARYTGYIPTHRPARLAKFGPEACASCHAEEVEDWARSHHAKANRLVSRDRDAAAFTPARRIDESGVTYEMAMEEDRFVLRVIDGGEVSATYDLIGVIGETPIRQYLAKLPGNKMQTISASYDVINDEWVDVYRGQDRMPGEWGHWKGQGMNWNSNCAYCHMTEFEKGFQFEADAYDSQWTQQSIACAECHGGLEEHVVASQAGDYLTGITTFDRTQIEENCATCHSRRDQLTADAFKPGDNYHDHFTLSLPDQPGLYYGDGQILDEVFVHASFRMSRMGHSGVSCMDCHDPHTMENILPVQNNMLCMRCHETGLMEAPIIEATAHSFHPAESTGNRCVECHMPKTPYMQIDYRADHGFHSPDPLMTRELGIPNACSKCHSDQSVDWAIEWSEQWYGEKLAESRQRKRARAISAAHAFEPQGLDGLLALAKDEEIPTWRATYAGLLRNYLPNESATVQLMEWLEDEAPLVRQRATRSLGQTLAEVNQPLLNDLLSDASRSVRIAAAMAHAAAGLDLPEGPARTDFVEYLEFNSDRPQSLFVLASKAGRQGDAVKVKKYVERAVELDRLNGEVYHQSAILLSSAGDNASAESFLFKGWEIAPENPILPYSLGLLKAETGDLEASIGFLEESVALEPRFYRAWYNLSLAYQKLGRNEDAARAMRRAQGQ